MPQTATLDYHALGTYKPLFLDYLDRFDRLSAFFAADPYDAGSWHRIASELQGKDHPRARVAEVLRSLNRDAGCDAATLESLDSLASGALAVVTGQQVGLFGGPLYTLYKALTAVRLAAEAERELGTRVVPIFWMDTDDHDFAEVQQASVIDRNQELRRLTYEPSADNDRLPVGRLELERSLDELMGAASDALPDTEFKAEIFGGLRECYAPGRTLAEAFGAWMHRMTRGSGLVVMDPSLPELKALGSELFLREVEEESASSASVRKTTQELLALGYHEQASPSEGQLNLFCTSPGRYPISAADSGFHISADGGGPVVSKKELKRLVASEPNRFSPNVLLRPVYQDTLLPTLAYVAGPNELAYFAQLGAVYRHFGVTMPLVASRVSFTVIERPQARFLERYDVDITKLNTDDESLLNDIMRAQSPPQLDEDLNRARTCIQEITSALERDLATVDKSLVPTVQSTRGKLLHHLKELESKTVRAIKRKNETVRSQFLATRTALFPGFGMQERSLSPLGFFTKHGWHFSKMLEESTDPTLKRHILLYA
jgi:bacillithiol biosynthesis cysteine-adding enzyme BshC